MTIKIAQVSITFAQWAVRKYIIIKMYFVTLNMKKSMKNVNNYHNFLAFSSLTIIKQLKNRNRNHFSAYPRSYVIYQTIFANILYAGVKKRTINHYG